MSHKELTNIATLDSVADAVLAIAVRDNTLFAGHQGGVIKVRLWLTWELGPQLNLCTQIWDLDTFTCIRNLKSHSVRLPSTRAASSLTLYSPPGRHPHHLGRRARLLLGRSERDHAAVGQGVPRCHDLGCAQEYRPRLGSQYCSWNAPRHWW